MSLGRMGRSSCGRREGQLHPGEFRGASMEGDDLQWAVWIAERMGLASSKVMVERAKRACRKARWAKLYSLDSIFSFR
jgi:hypothetical protein